MPCRAWDRLSDVPTSAIILMKDYRVFFNDVRHFGLNLLLMLDKSSLR